MARPRRHMQHFPIASGSWNTASPLANGVGAAGLNVAMLTDEFSGGLPSHRATTVVQGVNYPGPAQTTDPTYVDTNFGTKTGLSFGSGTAGVRFAGRGIGSATIPSLTLAAVVQVNSFTVPKILLSPGSYTSGATANYPGAANCPSLAVFSGGQLASCQGSITFGSSVYQLIAGHIHALAVVFQNSVGYLPKVDGPDMLVQYFGYDFTTGIGSQGASKFLAGLGFLGGNVTANLNGAVIAPVSPANPTWTHDEVFNQAFVGSGVAWSFASEFNAYCVDHTAALRASGFSVANVALPLSTTTVISLSGPPTGYRSPAWNSGANTPVFTWQNAASEGASISGQAVSGVAAATVSIGTTSTAGSGFLTDPISLYALEIPVAATTGPVALVIEGPANIAVGNPTVFTVRTEPADAVITGTLVANIADTRGQGLSVTTLSLTAGARTGQFIATPTTVGTGSYSAAGSGVATGTLAYTAANVALNPGNLRPGTHLEAPNSLTNGTLVVLGDGTNGSAAPTFGKPPYTEQWLSAARNDGTFAAITGQTGLNLSLGGQLSGARLTVKRTTTDSLGTTATTPLLDIACWAPRLSFAGFIGDSKIEQLSIASGLVAANYLTTAFPQFVMNSSPELYASVVALNRGIGGTQTLQWRSDAGNGFLSAAITAMNAACPAGYTKWCHLDLGINNTNTGLGGDGSTAQFLADMQNIVAALVAAGFLVILHKPWSPSNDIRLQQVYDYGDVLWSLVNRTTVFEGTGRNRQALANRREWSGDGTHLLGVGFPTQTRDFADSHIRADDVRRDGLLLGAAFRGAIRTGGDL